MDGDGNHAAIGHDVDDGEMEQHQLVSMSPCEPEMRTKAWRLCRDFLNGAWRKVSADDIVVKRFSGGLSNLLYFCALPNTVSPLANEPRQVLLRVYGQVHDDAPQSVITQSVIFTLLSERCLGPRLYGVFPGGRIEEYIPARPLLTAELSESVISSTIGEKLARVHALHAPINKEPTWLSDTMSRWLQLIRDAKAKPLSSANGTSCNDGDELSDTVIDCRPEDEPKIRKLFSYSLEKEYDWIMKTIPKVNSPVVFTHNDLQEGNILVKDNAKLKEDWLIFIDFEYCSYNYRGFDFANHMCEWCYNYTSTEFPYFRYDCDKYPTRDQQLHFIRAYLSHFPRDYQNAAGVLVRTRCEDDILKEIFFFTLVSHFFWALWSIVNGTNTQIQFGYWDYGLSRLDAYYTHKARVLSEYGGKRKATSPD